MVGLVGVVDVGVGVVGIGVAFGGHVPLLVTRQVAGFFFGEKPNEAEMEPEKKKRKGFRTRYCFLVGEADKE